MSEREERLRKALEEIARVGVVFDATGTASKRVNDIARAALAASSGEPDTQEPETCGHACYPTGPPGGSYCCGRKPGHDGLHASLYGDGAKWDETRVWVNIFFAPAALPAEEPDTQEPRVTLTERDAEQVARALRAQREALQGKHPTMHDWIDTELVVAALVLLSPAKKEQT